MEKKIHTELEIKEAMTKAVRGYNEHLVCVIFSNSNSNEQKRVTIYDGNQRVYSCDNSRNQASEGDRGLMSLISRFDASSNQLFVDITK